MEPSSIIAFLGTRNGKTDIFRKRYVGVWGGRPDVEGQIAYRQEEPQPIVKLLTVLQKFR